MLKESRKLLQFSHSLFCHLFVEFSKLFVPGCVRRGTRLLVDIATGERFLRPPPNPVCIFAQKLSCHVAAPFFLWCAYMRIKWVPTLDFNFLNLALIASFLCVDSLWLLLAADATQVVTIVMWCRCQLGHWTPFTWPHRCTLVGFESHQVKCGYWRLWIDRWITLMFSTNTEKKSRLMWES